MAARPTRSRVARATGIAAVVAGTAAGAAGATAGAAHRSTRMRRRLDAVDTLELGVRHPFEWTPDRVLSVVSDTGSRLHVEIDEPPGWEGAPTVVFSHGYCLSLRSWVLQRRALVDAGYRCVLWDQRGHGRSQPAPAATYSIDQLGLDLESVIAAAAPTGPLVLAGHSMGGMTMMALADQRPRLVDERVVAAAFVATSAGGVGPATFGVSAGLSRGLGRVAPRLLAGLAARPGLWRHVRVAARDVESLLVDRFSFASPVSEDTVRFAADLLLGTDLDVMGGFITTLEAHDRLPALAAYAGVDVLVLNGEGDRLTPPEHSLVLVQELPHSEHVVITDAGHLVMLEHPTLVSAQLMALIDRAADARAKAVVAARGRVSRRITDVGRRRRIDRVLDPSGATP